MALDVSGLSAYVDENKMPLIKKSILEGRTVSMITVQPEIKSSATINIIDSTLVAQAGACGWNATGTTALTQRTLSVCPIKVNEPICIDTLEGYYTQKMINAGSYSEDAPEFEAIYADEKAGKIQAMVEDIVWQGNTSTGTGNLALCDGFIATLDAASASTVAGNVDSVTAITAANIIDVVDDIAGVVPTDIVDADDLVLFMGYDTYRTWARALRDANLYHYSGNESADGDFMMYIPGTNVKAVAVRGLNGTNRMFLSKASNFYFGTDLLSDFESFKLFYSEDNDELRFIFKGKLGVNVAFPDLVVDFILA